MATLQEIRARLAAQENKSNTKSTSTQTDNVIYPHWNAEEGSTATVRFLPDADPNNPYFWVERNLIKLPFQGVIGKPEMKNVEVTVPCIEMFGPGNVCPILTEVRAWYKDESLTSMANKYWKKRSYLFQGFVRQNPMADDKPPENPIRRFIISPQIFAIIKASLMDPEMDELPTDYLRGLDLNIKKTSKGGYSDYSTSTWARKETPLTDVEQQAIDQFKLFNLSDFLPKKPNEAELKILKEMFEASVDNQPYDPERWANYYKPWNLDLGDNQRSSKPAVSATVSAPATAKSSPSPFKDDSDDGVMEAAQPVVVPKSVPTTSSTPTSGGSDRAADILAMIRSRQTKSA